VGPPLEAKRFTGTYSKNKKSKSLSSLNKIDYSSLWQDKWQMRNSITAGATQKTIAKNRHYQQVTIVETA